MRGAIIAYMPNGGHVRATCLGGAMPAAMIAYVPSGGTYAPPAGKSQESEVRRTTQDRASVAQVPLPGLRRFKQQQAVDSR